MGIPNLKRVKVSSEQDLRSWLDKNKHCEKSVMLVTFSEPSNPKYLDRELVRDAFQLHGWISGRRYTLNDGLIGQVFSRPDA